MKRKTILRYSVLIVLLLILCVRDGKFDSLSFVMIGSLIGVCFALSVIYMRVDKKITNSVRQTILRSPFRYVSVTAFEEQLCFDGFVRREMLDQTIRWYQRKKANKTKLGGIWLNVDNIIITERQDWESIAREIDEENQRSKLSGSKTPPEIFFTLFCITGYEFLADNIHSLIKHVNYIHPSYFITVVVDEATLKFNCAKVPEKKNLQMLSKLANEYFEE